MSKATYNRPFRDCRRPRGAGRVAGDPWERLWALTGKRAKGGTEL